MFESGNRLVDRFLGNLVPKPQDEQRRGKPEALRLLDSVNIGTDPLVLQMIVALSTGDEETADHRCSDIMFNRSWWSRPRVTAEVVSALAKTLYPHHPRFLDRLLCKLQDDKQRGLLTYPNASGILAGILLSAGSPLTGWVTYARFSTSRRREEDENLILALIILIVTWPTETLKSNSISRSYVEEAGRLLDQAILEYVSPDQENISTDHRVGHFRDVSQPPEREQAIARIWEALRNHTASQTINSVGEVFLDKFTHRLLGRMSVKQRANVLPNLSTMPEQAKS